MLRALPFNSGSIRAYDIRKCVCFSVECVTKISSGMPVNQDILHEQIKQQGEIVRKLKAAKESKEKVIISSKGNISVID